MRKSIPKNTRQRVWEKYNGHCAYCGTEIMLKEMQVDHFIPLHLGGKDEESNYMPACRMCNHYKSTMPAEKFRQQLQMIKGRLKERSYIYRLALKYGMVEETDRPIVFYYEAED